jgi:hypothetical protein
LIVHILLCRFLANEVLSVYVDTLVPENLAAFHHTVKYYRIDTVEEAEPFLSVITYSHSETGAKIHKEEYLALSSEEAQNYRFESGWRYLCTANNIDYRIYCRRNGETVKTIVAMYVFDTYLPWELGSAVVAIGLLLLAVFYAFGVLLLLVPFVLRNRKKKHEPLPLSPEAETAPESAAESAPDPESQKENL